MSFLPKIEEIILLAIWKLGGNAFGTLIIQQVEKDTGSSWVSGSVYSALARLKKHGFINTVEKERSSEGIGRPRVYYELTESGKEKLLSIQRVTSKMWEGVPNLDEGY
jgi:DNA-binding PadR family transcriptional regulator